MGGKIIYGLACVVTDKDRKVLLLKRAPDKKIFPNKWFVVGAYPFDNKDNMDKIAQDEVKDETGLDCKFLKRGKSFENSVYGEVVEVFPYLALTSGKNVILNHEHTEFKWIKISEIDNYDTAPVTKSIINQFLKMDINAKKLLVICGPTATGKTSLALQLSKLFNGEIISADSRQIYKDMNIGTGKDIPSGFEFRISNLEFQDFTIGYYTDGNIRIWGYDLASPKEEFSVSQYINISQKIISDIWLRNKLPILVGGTGFYIKGVIDGIETVEIPRSQSLRNKYKNKNTEELRTILQKINPQKLKGMNNSDKNNPRRLIRAIEIGKWMSDVGSEKPEKEKRESQDVLLIGLIAPKISIEEKIKERVDKRVKEGIIDEIKKLLDSGVTWDMQSMQGLGYRQWINYFEKCVVNSRHEMSDPQETKETEKSEKLKAIEKWQLEEIKYAKRQKTWFKKDKKINWFDITAGNWQNEVEKSVRKWYSN